ncbi:hypothetical protein [Streptomyces sp. NPDC048644]|uniref:hypothetical protein n=1 Tax=Streptomyces sp. NPDC048644 TaxID=3365582 RepID=UPI00371A1721
MRAATVGRARRCTAGEAGAVVNVAGLAARSAPDGTGAIRGPTGRRTGRAEAAAVSGPGVPAREATASPTGDPGSAGCCGAATGRVSDGMSSAADGPVDGVSRSLTRPPGPPSSTACDSVPAKDGFCQVVSEALKPGSATCPGDRVPDVRWIGGSPAQPAGPLRSVPVVPVVPAGRGSAAGAGPAAGVPPFPAAASDEACGRPRSLSRSPISPPSMRA